ncbi:unnamed protein product [Bathycoccus prasinos]
MRWRRTPVLLLAPSIYTIQVEDIVRNLLWNKRVKAHLILAFSTSTNCESMAYRSFSLSEFDARGVRKVTTGITGLWQPSVHSDVAF